jgi:dihydropteroate synthase
VPDYEPSLLFPASFLLSLSMSYQVWKLATRELPYGERTLVMGILNVTPDSFSDGGKFFDLDQAAAQAETMIDEGADIIDIGGESTRPGSEFVSEEEELRRVLPIIERVKQRGSLPISIDTTKASVARAALAAGAEIVNDISGLRFEPALADEVARASAGLVLMHSRGTPKDMQQLPPAPEILPEVISGLTDSVSIAQKHGVSRASIVIDPGIGFGKTPGQNIELIAQLDQIRQAFPDLPLMIGTSRKSFLGKLLNGAPADERLYGSIASVVAAVLRGAQIVRVHDVKATVEALKVADAVRSLARQVAG